MDPNANLDRQLAIASEVNELLDNGSREVICLAEELTELVISLNEWIMKGGALPRDWRR